MTSDLSSKLDHVMKDFVKKEHIEKVRSDIPDTELSDDIPRKGSYFKRVKGSDPCAATCRGKLQFRRSKLNQEINKHLMLRQGAENLLRAAENKRVRQAVSLELSFVNSNLQYLKEELADLNSSVEVYQSDSNLLRIPMIPFGLKETKHIDFADPFKSYIEEHYGEDASQYLSAIQEFVDLRQAIRTPQRSESGVNLLLCYYNQLYFVERRFFPSEKHLGIHFEWFDSLTGLPSVQRTVAFEKASVLFNAAALYSQLAARQSRDSHRHLATAVDNYLQAAAIYRYILENFSNAPSRDLHPDVLEVLAVLLLAQAAESLLEKFLVTSGVAPACYDVDDKHHEDGNGGGGSHVSPALISRLEAAQECAHVAGQYSSLHETMSRPALQCTVPASWLQLVSIKAVYYQALAHHHFAIGLLDHQGPISRRALDILHVAQIDDINRIASVEYRVPRNTQQKNYLGKCHLREALSQHEECQRLYRMSRELGKRDTVLHVLRDAMSVSAERYEMIARLDEFNAPVDPPVIIGCSQFQLDTGSGLPDLGSRQQTANVDLFAALGPLEVFSAHHRWTPARRVLIDRTAADGLGFSVKMEAPVVVVAVETDSLAERVGLKEGDFIVALNGQDLKWASHSEVVALIRQAGTHFTVDVVTPLHKSSQEELCESPEPSSAGVLMACASDMGGSVSTPSSAVFSDRTWGSLSTSSGVSSVGSASHNALKSVASTRTNNGTAAGGGVGVSRSLSWNPFKRVAVVNCGGETVDRKVSTVSR